MLSTVVPLVGWVSLVLLMAQPVDWTSPAEVLIWIVSGAGAGAIAFGLWELFERWWPKLAELSAFVERVITLALTVLVALIAYGLQLAASYRTVPETWMGAIEEIFAIAAMAIMTALTIHGVKHEIQHS